ncbi:MAG TPA: M56 family metallopeptidase [Verrucomicrobiae bacterium]|nr:M56 family metallopeptidase [Verrucomicrobiae bacterium]
MNTLVADALARFILVLALELGVLILAAHALQRWIHAGSLRRLLWQTAMLVAVALIGLELCGAGNAAAAWAARWWSPAVEPRANSVHWVVTEKMADASEAHLADSPQTVGREHERHTVSRGRIAGQGGGNAESWVGRCAWLWLTGVGGVVAWLGIGRLVFVLRARRRPIRQPALLESVRALALLVGWRGKLAVTEIAGLRAPIAYGLWRAGIGLPPGFFGQHSETERQAILAHELAHIAGRDLLWQLFADGLAALLWWHPLMWTARRSFRAARELSADEASAVVEGGPAALAACLVRMGRRLLGPHPSERWDWRWLGVAGMAFRSGLGRRVERLIMLRADASRRASLHGRFALGACATPVVAAVIVMATGWAREESRAGGMELAFRASVLGLSLLAFAPADAAPASPAQPGQPAQPPQTANQEASSPSKSAETRSSIYRVQKGDTLARIVQTLKDQGMSLTAQQLMELNPKVQWTRLRVGQEIVIPNVPPAFAEVPAIPTPSRQTTEDVQPSAPGRAKLQQKLDSIRHGEFGAKDQPLSNVVELLSREVRVLDREQRGVNFIIADSEEAQQRVRIDPPLRDITLRQALRALTASADRPLNYSVEDYAVVFSSKPPAPPLHTSWFKVDTNACASALPAKLGADSALARAKAGPGATGAAFLEDLRALLAKTGLDTTASGRQLFFHEGNGMVMIRGTLAELDWAETLFAELNGSEIPPQITIEVKVVELPESAVRELGSDNPNDGTAELLSIAGMDWRTNAPGTFSRALTAPQARVLLRALEQRQGVTIFSAPKLTTLSGRQAQIKAVDVRSILFAFETVTNKASAVPGNLASGPTVITRPLMKSFELGPVVDIIPLLQSDREMLTLNVTAGIKEFLGYDSAEGSAPTAPAPRFRQHQMSAIGAVEDGQTLVLAGGTLAEENVEATGRIVPAHGPPAGGPPAAKTDDLVRQSRLIWITPRLIDPAGNPLHP